jgi:hypothetical protein
VLNTQGGMSKEMCNQIDLIFLGAIAWGNGNSGKYTRKLTGLNSEKLTEMDGTDSSAVEAQNLE